MLKPLVCALGLALLFPSLASAEVRVSGFGQVIAGQTTGSNTVFPNGYDEDLDFERGSLFAVQVSADLNERVSATGQIVAQGSEDFDADFAWAYVGIKLDHGFNLTLGRQRTPLYRYSDFLDVGYAYPWVFAPRAVYNLTFNNADGASLGWNHAFGSWFSQAKVFYGSFDGSLGGQDRGTLDQFTGVSWDLNRDSWLNLRAAYFQADVDLQYEALTPLIGALNQFGLPETARLIAPSEDKGRFKNVGFEIDRNNWLVIGEWVETRVKDSVIPDIDNMYVTAGYRFGNVMPHLTWGMRDGEALTQILDTVPAQHPLFGTVAAVVASQGLDDTYTGVGLRWDFARNVAFKADYVRYRTDIAARQDANLIAAGVVFTY